MALMFADSHYLFAIPTLLGVSPDLLAISGILFANLNGLFAVFHNLFAILTLLAISPDLLAISGILFANLNG